MSIEGNWLRGLATVPAALAIAGAVAIGGDMRRATAR